MLNDSVQVFDPIRDLYSGEEMVYYCSVGTWFNHSSQYHKFTLTCQQLTPTTADWTALPNPVYACVSQTVCEEPTFIAPPVISDHVNGTERHNGDVVRYECNDTDIYQLYVDGSAHAFSFYDTTCAWGGAWDLSVTLTCPRKLIL